MLNNASTVPLWSTTEQLSASELKKLQRKQKKAQLKAQAAKAAEEKTKDHKTHGKGGAGGGAEEDKKADEKEPKFDPDKLLQVTDTLKSVIFHSTLLFMDVCV